MNILLICISFPFRRHSLGRIGLAQIRISLDFNPPLGTGIVVIDQMNAVEDSGDDSTSIRAEKNETLKFLKLCRRGRPAILSSSANYQAFLRQKVKESTEDTMHVYGGFTKVSLNKNNLFLENGT